MDKEICELEKDICNNIINYAYDEHDGEEYRMYLENVSSDINDFLFIRVVKGERPLIYVCDHDDMNAMFVNVSDLDITTLIKVSNQIHDKSKGKKESINEIILKFKLGYDVPAWFATKSIKDNLTDKVGQLPLS